MRATDVEADGVRIAKYVGPVPAPLIDKVRPAADIIPVIPPVASVAGCEARQLAGLSDLMNAPLASYQEDGFRNCPRASAMTSGNWHAPTGPLRNCLKNVG